MSISFSGLASGIDTSSWIDSLVSVKQAKVDQLEEEKENVLLSQETLNSIKSFFNSFRSVIEKVTDAKFGVVSMDLFAQKLASSSNTNLLTATATSEAEEASYEVLIDNLATSTQAMSGFQAINTIVQTTTATIDSKLVDIGVKTGDIGITVSGTQHIISIEENDTIGSFIEKLNGIGVDASFNEKTGVFGINLDNGAIDDTLAVQDDGSIGTGIIDALHLGEIGGYESKSLEYSTTETIVSTATEDTKISDLGEINAGDITVNANDTQYTIHIDENTTIKDLLDELHANGIDANLSSDGVLTITDAEIIDSSNTGIMEALGLETDIYSKTQTSGDLNFQTIVTTTTEATSDTKLEDLTAWDSVGSNPVIIAKDSDGNETTINVNGTMTIGDIVDELNSAGLSASLSSSGILSISGGSVSGNVAEALGIQSGSNNTGNITAEGNVLYSKEVTYATGDNTMRELGIDIFQMADDGYQFAVFNSDNQCEGLISVNLATSINDIFLQLENYGITGSINEGRITLNSSNGNWVRGGIVEQLGISRTSSVVTGTTNQSSSSPISYTETKAIEGTSTFEQAGIDASGKTMVIKTKENGNYVGTVTITSNSQTFDDLFGMLDDYGITASISNGVISLTSSDYYVSGELADLLGFGINSSSSGSTVGATITSTASLTYTSTAVAEGSSLISDFVELDSNINKNKITIHTSPGSSYDYTVTESTTFYNLLSEIRHYGVSVTMSDGRLVFNSTNGAYIEDYTSGGILSKLGITTQTISDTRTTTGISQTSSSTVYYTVGADITEDTYITSAVTLTSSNNELIIQHQGGWGLGTITITDTMTFGDLKDSLQSWGINMTINSNDTLSLSSGNERYVIGGFAEAIGWDVQNNITTNTEGLYSTGSTLYRTVTVAKSNTSTAGIQWTEYGTETATLDSTVADYIYSTSRYMVIKSNRDPSYSETLTISTSDTFSTLGANLYDRFGIAMSYDSSSGKFTFSNYNPEFYIDTTTGAAKDLSITTTSYNTIVTTGITQTGDVVFASNSNATLNTKFADIIEDWDTIDKNIYIKSSAGNILKTVTLSSNASLNVFNGLEFTDLSFNRVISASMNQGVLTLTNTPNSTQTNQSTGNVYLEGDVIDALGITKTATGHATMTIGATCTGELLTTTSGATATSSTKLVGFLGKADESKGTLEVGDKIGVWGYVNEISTHKTYTVTSSSTIGDLLSFIQSNYGVSASISGGKITFSGDKNHYLHFMSSVESSGGNDKDYGHDYLGFGKFGDSYYSNWETTTLIAKQTIVSSTETIKTKINESTKLTDISSRFPSNGSVNINYNGQTATISVVSTDTLATFFTKLSSIGITATVSDGRITIEGGDTYITGATTGLLYDLGLYTGNGSSYTISNQTYYKNGTTTYAVTRGTMDYHPINGTIKLNSTGITNGTYNFTFVQNGTSSLKQFTVSSTTDFDDFADFMNNNSITVSYTNGYFNGYPSTKLTFTSQNPESVYISYFDTTLKDKLKLSGDFSTVSSGTVTSDTTFYDLGLTNSYYYVTIGSNGTNTSYNFTVNSSTTIGDFASWLGDKGGITAYWTDGKLYVSAASGYYIYDMERVLAQTFGIYTGNGTTYTVITDTTKTNTTSDMLGSSEVKTLSGDTKWTDLGFSTGSTNVFNTNIDLGEKMHYFTATSESTVNDFVNWVNNNVEGFTASVSDGKLTISGSNGNYITAMGSTFKDIFHLSDDPDKNYNVTEGLVIGNTNSNKQQNIGTTTANSNTTLGDLGLGSNATITVKNKDGSSQTITVTSSNTLSSINSALPIGASISVTSDGKINISGNSTGWVESMSDNLKNIFKLAGVGNGYTYNTTGNTHYENTSSSSLNEITTNLLTQTTVLNKLNGYSNGDGKIAIHKDDGSFVTISINATGTLQDFFDQISGYGLTGNVDTQGRVSITGNGNVYLQSVSGGSNILDILNLGAVSNTTKTIYSNTTTASLSATNLVFATSDTKLENLEYSDGTKINFDASGNAALVVQTKDEDGTVKNLTVNFSKTQTLGNVLSYLSSQGISAFINSEGKFSVSSNSLVDFDISGTLGSYLMGAYNKSYEISSNLATTEINTTVVNATRDTLLSALGVTTGEYYIYNNGVKHTAIISSDETLGSFLDTLNSFGIQTGLINKDGNTKLVIKGSGNSYIAKSNSVANSSNIVEKLFGTDSPDEMFNYSGIEQIITTVTTTSTATEDTLISVFDTPWGGSTLTSAGDLVFSVNGENKVINISADETFGSLVEKLQQAGVEASFSGGKLYISDMHNFSIDTAKTTSSIINPNANIFLTDKDKIDGFMESSTDVTQTTTTLEEYTLSAANYADMNTKLSTLNISDGTLSIFRNGEKAIVNIESDKTFADLRSQISSKFSDVDLKFENGKLIIYSKADGVNVEVGTTTDTSNILAITGLSKNLETGNTESSRALYKVNANSLVTDSDLFRKGNITEGNFYVGNQEIIIDDKTKISDIISQINSSEEANATAYWDNIDGKLVITSRTTGAALINIEAGTSNFTDIMGYTSSEWNADGSLKVTRMQIDNQILGDNAKFKINGVSYTSTSNMITSDISRIEGVTLDLKGLTDGSAVTVTIEKDKEKVADAISDIVDAYNELMENVDEAISTSGTLHDQSALKMIRNRLRSLMTSTVSDSAVFRNLDAIGISVSSASANNISTSNESIINLHFDKEKFLEAYSSDSNEIKKLLVGNATNIDDYNGILVQVENLLEESLKSVSGYFDIANNSYQNEIKKIDSNIEKANRAIERYKISLENKFASMDMLIGNMQQQYSSFLGS